MFTPELDERCSTHFRYRQLIECGETQKKYRIQNLPKEPESYQALKELAINILDPVVSEFGRCELTYCFAGQELTKHIKGRIAPSLDQHAAFERNKNKKLICERGGAAVDFIYSDLDMGQVAIWIVKNCAFDRIYFYGSSRPIHVSYGQQHSRQVVEVKISQSTGRLYPKVLRNEDFIKGIFSRRDD